MFASICETNPTVEIVSTGIALMSFHEVKEKHASGEAEPQKFTGAFSASTCNDLEAPQELEKIIIILLVLFWGSHPMVIEATPNSVHRGTMQCWDQM